MPVRSTHSGQCRELELRRRELELACAMRALMGPSEVADWRQLEATMDAFVGERDAMGPLDVDRLYADLGISGIEALSGVPDEKVLDAIVRGGYGRQRIAGDILPGDPHGTAPLPRSFSFVGQRYIVDSHVLSDLVYDRVTPPTGKPKRLMPSPLDIAFAVFGNDTAGSILNAEIEAFGYGPNLQQARDRVDAQGEQFWDSSLYASWLGALRMLSPSSANHLPSLAQSEAWERRMLSAQLASWAELRHDTILYAKQSYTSSISCSFPDVYVDPYPGFYDRLARLADRGKALIDVLDFGQASFVRDRANRFFGQLGVAARRLHQIAEEQQQGLRPSPEDLVFINQALVEDPPGITCGGPPPREFHGWYVDLFYGGEPFAFKPTIADVHTQPTDEGGNPVGRVLHVGTAAPRLIVVNVDGARSFVGFVSDYSELVTQNFQRLTDREWEDRVSHANPDDVPWMRDLVVR